MCFSIHLKSRYLGQCVAGSNEIVVRDRDQKKHALSATNIRHVGRHDCHKEHIALQRQLRNL